MTALKYRDPATDTWIYIPTAGPPGPPGPAGAGTDEVWVGTSAPTDAAIELWYDPDAVPAGVAGWPLVVSDTPPTAADYGTATIPLDAVWIQSP